MSDKEDTEYWRADVERIRLDSISSSLSLGAQVLDIFEGFIEKQQYRNRTELLQSLSKLSNALVRAKPVVALIYNYTHDAIDFIQAIPKEERNINVIKKMAIDKINQVRQDREDKKKKITRNGARFIMDQHIVFTHSASSLVESILLEARRQKKRFHLICTESRPRLEGLALSKKMASAGVKTTVIPDADIVRALHEAHFILTGADRITEDTFINKTGTGAIALVSREFNKPFYVAAELDKILLKRNLPLRFRENSPEELLSEPLQNLTPQNNAFEEIPIHFLHKLICEDGIFERDEFVERFL